MTKSKHVKNMVTCGVCQHLHQVGSKRFLICQKKFRILFRKKKPKIIEEAKAEIQLLKNYVSMIEAM